jgi:signal transduction histidine kinase
MANQIAAEVQRETVSLADEYRATGAATAAASIERRLRRGGMSYYLMQDGNGAWVAGNIAPVAPILGFVELQVHLQSQGEDALSRQTEDRRQALGYGVLLTDGTFVMAADDVGRLENAKRAIRTAFLIAGGLSMLLAIVGGLLLSGGFLRRIDAINRTAAQIMEGSLAARIPARRHGDEVDTLATNLNAMLDRIQSLMENLQQVSSDVAHDLRTPLARLRQNLESARTTATTVEDFRSATDAAIAETEGLLGTFAALLRIAQVESGSRKAGFASVDLSELFEFVATTFQPVAEDTGQRFLSDIEPGAVITGDRELLLQLVTNLVENAIRHTPPGSTIELRLRREAEEVVAVVSDSGPGIPPAEREKVFRRFYRRDASRTTSGSGLGLALVAAIANLHDAKIALSDNAVGLVVQLRFRVAATASNRG